MSEPTPNPPDLHATVLRTAEAMGLSTDIHDGPLRLAMHSEPLLRLRDEIEAAHAAQQADLLGRIAVYLHAGELSLRSMVAFAKTSFDAFGEAYPDWLNRLDGFLAQDFPQPPADGSQSPPDQAQPQSQQSPQSPQSSQQSPGNRPA